MTNINNWPSWNSKITSASASDSIEVGSSFKLKINGATINSTLHSVEKNQIFGWSGTTIGATAIHNWSLETVDQN